MSDPVKLPGAELRLDGLYRSGGALSDGSPITYFLRFKDDGVVEGAWMRGEDQSGADGTYELDRRVAAQRNSGRFAVEGSSLNFSLTDSAGAVDYRGAIAPDGTLTLDSNSHINGHREQGRRYEFVEVEKGPRRLTELIPRSIKLECMKLKSGTVFEHGCGLRATSSGWPLPGEGETALGRWNVMGSRLLIDTSTYPNRGPYISGGSLGVLVTDKSLRGSFYEGKGPVGKLAIVRHVFTFYWPYSLMTEPDYSHYKDDRRMHVMIEDPEQDGHLGLQGIVKAKGNKPDDFLRPVLSARNRAPEFMEQLFKARERFLGAGE